MPESRQSGFEATVIFARFSGKGDKIVVSLVSRFLRSTRKYMCGDEACDVSLQVSRDKRTTAAYDGREWHERETDERRGRKFMLNSIYSSSAGDVDSGGREKCFTSCTRHSHTRKRRREPECSPEGAEELSYTFAGGGEERTKNVALSQLSANDARNEIWDQGLGWEWDLMGHHMHKKENTHQLLLPCIRRRSSDSHFLFKHMMCLHHFHKRLLHPNTGRRRVCSRL